MLLFSIPEEHLHKLLGSRKGRVLAYRPTVEPGESVSVPCTFFHCLVRTFTSVTLYISASVMWLRSVLIGKGYWVSRADVHSVYHSGLHPLVIVSFVVLFLTRSMTRCLFIFNGLISLEYCGGFHLPLRFIGFRDFTTYGDFPLNWGGGIFPPVLYVGF